jgi:PTH1 family peptidyl-tRNA hydrolase
MPIDLVLGLGNPGEEYAPTRHNIGFRVVDEMQKRQGGGLWVSHGSAEVAVVLYGRFVALARPMLFMNRSGKAAVKLLEEFQIESKRLLVILDDVDLPLGVLRIRRSGGPGTHNGLRDLCGSIGSNFPRLRVGVSGGTPQAGLARYVLSPFDGDELELAQESVCRAADAAEYSVRAGLERAMTRYNRRSE